MTLGTVRISGTMLVHYSATAHYITHDGHDRLDDDYRGHTQVYTTISQLLVPTAAHIYIRQHLKHTLPYTTIHNCTQQYTTALV